MAKKELKFTISYGKHTFDDLGMDAYTPQEDKA